MEQLYFKPVQWMFLSICREKWFGFYGTWITLTNRFVLAQSDADVTLKDFKTLPLHAKM